VRQILASCRRSKGFCTYSASVKREAVRYLQVRLDEGAGLATISRELGVSHSTVETWAKAIRKGSELARPTVAAKTKSDFSLVPIVVRQPEVSEHVVPHLEIDFPGGIRLQATGVCPAGLARAIEVLRRSA